MIHAGPVRGGGRRWGRAAALALLLALAGAPQAAGAGFSFRADVGDPSPKQVFSGGGLRLYAGCNNIIGTELGVVARSTRNNAVIHVDAQRDVSSDEVRYGEDDDFDKGAAQQFSVTGVANEDAVGRIVYSRGGKVVTIDYVAEDDSVPGQGDCLFAGIAQVQTRDDPKAIVFRDKRNDPPERVFQAGGLRLTAECQNFMASPVAILKAKSLTNGGAIAYSSRADKNSDGTAEFLYGAEDTLDEGDVVTLTANQATPGTEFIDNRSASGQIVFGSPGAVVTIDYLAEPLAAKDRCLVGATARIAPKGSPNRVRFVKAQDELEGQTVFHRGGVRLRARCNASSPATSFTTKSTGSPNGTVHFGEQSDVGDNGTDEQAYAEIDDMDDVTYDSTLFLSNGDNATGQFVYAAPGPSVVAFDYLIDRGGAFGKPCALAGAAATFG